MPWRLRLQRRISYLRLSPRAGRILLLASSDITTLSDGEQFVDVTIGMAGVAGKLTVKRDVRAVEERPPALFPRVVLRTAPC